MCFSRPEYYLIRELIWCETGGKFQLQRIARTMPRLDNVEGVPTC